MNLRRFCLPFFVFIAVQGSAHANDTDSQAGPLGKVSFPTSCDPKVQPAFEGVRGIAAARTQPIPQLPRLRARRGNGG